MKDGISFFKEGKGVFFSTAEEFYRLPISEIRSRVSRLRRWPYDRPIKRVVPLEEALKRVKKKELQGLVFARAVGIIEGMDGRIYPVRILDVIWGEEATASLLKKEG